VACFAALDTATKFVSASVPAVMAIWFRYLFQALVTALALLPRRGRRLLHTRRPWLQCLRALLLMLVSLFAFFSLKFMPVGEFTALVMLAPLLITLLAATSLGERVSAPRWLCVVGGFAGALIVIRPGDAKFTWAALLPLLMVAMIAWFQILTSKLSKTDDAGTTQLYTGIVGAGTATLLLPFAWEPLGSWSLWVILVLIAVFSTVGHLLLIKAYARAPASALTPFLYFQIAFATLGGWLVFSYAPDLTSVAGLVVIGACGAAGTWLKAREDRVAAARQAPG
jgi:drug/metabolite transporter (DMT)-like permease